MTPPITPARPAEHDEPIYWFARLELALAAGDYAVAARARRELERLGYRVARPQRGKRGGRHGQR